ncbi:D-beta-hydroxybutyrate dehydrogenase, mitochondrial-like [Ostrea edulis]|uniref:D-beta-hydroxybutyrate dehydrogenase, mitochondrial-like n=1 Tax=Ostrea edulis TaxID=37623 RepID=UPI002095045C|nr:D-beta-hydroxybutyrate dehydrogenase, mitochondrial-like [Ostrea edulis]XP_048762665.1 D-beta-hydroxybutyrate dehydrogenase, mitochondrial-like [Ostrea edulis]XP_056018602.1 D-beta-hydroxybutyrate dehydrogenase, mitochondrial-like [Ostrea edulis]
MKLTEFIGLQFFESMYLLVLFCIPIVVAQQYIGAIVLALLIFLALSTLTRKLLYKAVEIKGQGVLITGCDTGFGNACAVRLDAMGFTVFAGCLNPECEGAKRLQESTTGKLHILKMDIRSDSDIKAVLEYVTETHESTGCGLWAVINNAGVNFLGDIDFCTMDMYHRIMDVNLFGMVRTTKAFLPLLRKSKGRVVNVTSVRGRCVFPVASAYTMAKFAGEAFSDGLRIEMRKFGVKVVIVEPGNFGGATGMLNEKSLAIMKRDFNTMWTEAGEEVKETYGKEYLDRLFEGAKGTSATSYPTLAPVLNALEDAVINQNPKIRYLVDGGNGMIDVFCILARLYSFLPESVMDWIVSRLLSRELPPLKAKTQ